MSLNRQQDLTKSAKNEAHSQATRSNVNNNDIFRGNVSTPSSSRRDGDSQTHVGMQQPTESQTEQWEPFPSQMNKLALPCEEPLQTGARKRNLSSQNLVGELGPDHSAGYPRRRTWHSDSAAGGAGSSGGSPRGTHCSAMQWKLQAYTLINTSTQLSAEEKRATLQDIMDHVGDEPDGGSEPVDAASPGLAAHAEKVPIVTVLEPEAERAWFHDQEQPTTKSEDVIVPETDRPLWQSPAGADVGETKGEAHAGESEQCASKPKGNSTSEATLEVGNKYEHLYKILIIGELGTGKTSIIKRYVHQFFSAHYRATIGVDFALKVLHWDPNTIIRLQLWDIAGQERFGSMTRVYYKEAVAAFVVFDASRSVTFDAVMKWKNDLDEKVQLPNGEPVPCVLLANKSDLTKEGLVTTPDKMAEWVTQHGFAGWFETSAKENTGIEEASNFLVGKILAHEKSGSLVSEGEDTEVMAVGDGQPSSRSCSC